MYAAISARQRRGPRLVPLPIYNKTLALPSGIEIFFRESGLPSNPTLLLLHGFPTGSHQFRNLIPLLSHKFHIIAPDFPSFGFTVVPETLNYKYTFDNLSRTLEEFVITGLNLEKFAIYVFDYGAPVGLRLALRNKERITGVISQNGNAYLEGLGGAWQPVQELWKENSAANRETVRSAALTLDGVKWQYTHGVSPSRLAFIQPETYTLDWYTISKDLEIQLDLFYDYRTNLELYPEFQKFFREKSSGSEKFPFLVIWGAGDLFFVPAGAKAFEKDVKGVKVRLLEDGGHFALETHTQEIAENILETFA